MFCFGERGESLAHDYCQCDPGGGSFAGGAVLRVRGQGSGNRDQGTGIRDQGTGIREQGLGIREQGSGNRDQEGGNGR